MAAPRLACLPQVLVTVSTTQRVRFGSAGRDDGLSGGTAQGDHTGSVANLPSIHLSHYGVRMTEERPRHRLSMTLLMTPDMANFTGDVHGGTILKLLDQVAFTCAGRWARAYVVTLSVDRVVFRQPIHVGELVTFDASVNLTGRSSMEVGIRVSAEDFRTGTVRHTNSCYFTMVAIDDDRTPVAVPTLKPGTDDERRRWADAETRRATRRA